LETRISGDVFVVGNDVRALDIMPNRFKSSRALDAKELALTTFADIHPGFAEKAIAGEYRIVIAGHNFGGGGKTIEGPVFALRGSGIRLVVAESFARYFLRNSINNAFPVLVCPGITAAAATGDHLEVDLATASVRNTTRGVELTGQALSPNAIAIIAAGGLVPYARQRLAQTGAAA
jgi:3-isopropylmalate/(R)-2-methylmalate dehydratase small subunit